MRLLAGALGLGTATAALWWSGEALPGPTSLDRQDVMSWLGTSDPVVAAFAALRLAGLVLAGWMVLTGGIALVVHLSRLRRIRWLRRLVDRLCLPVVRRLVHGVAGVALAAATLAPGAAGALDSVTTSTVPARGEVATLVALEAPAASPTAPSVPPPSPDADMRADRAVIIALDPTALPPEPSPPSLTAPPPNPTPGAPPSPSTRLTPSTPPPSNTWSAGEAETGSASARTPATGRTWRIEPGQHLWHIAEHALAEHLGGPPDDEAVAAYWAVVIEANRNRLIVPTNPDLVFTGQEIVLPPLSSGP